MKNLSLIRPQLLFKALNMINKLTNLTLTLCK